MLFAGIVWVYLGIVPLQTTRTPSGQPPGPTGCAADLNGDGLVGPADLAALLGAWGSCPGCATDLDGDDIVGPTDLAALLGGWGPCPPGCVEDAECSDQDFCTFDACDPITGRCLNTFVPQCPGIDMVFILDTSEGLLDEANTLCNNIELLLQAIQDALSNPMFPEDVPVTATIYGITEDAGDFDPPDFVCLSDNVLDVFGPQVPGDNGTCPDLDGCATVQSQKESWGPATAIVAEEFPWQDPAEAIRLIIPISDEGPCCGGSIEVFACGLSDQFSIDNAISIANNNGVVVSPIIGTLPAGAPVCIAEFGEELANGTGGSLFLTQDLIDFPQDIVALITKSCPCFAPPKAE